MRIELVVRDSCLIPQLERRSESLRIIIGLEHDFDDILDLCGVELSNDQMQLVHKLWSDDDFPRRFVRSGEDLVITARD